MAGKHKGDMRRCSRKSETTCVDQHGAVKEAVEKSMNMPLSVILCTLVVHRHHWTLLTHVDTKHRSDVPIQSSDMPVRKIHLLKEHMFGRPGEHCFFSNDHWWQCDCGCQERGLCCSHRPGDKALGFNQKHFRDVATHRGGISRSQWGCILIHRMNINSSVLLGGGFKYVLFSPLLGEMIQFD